MDLKIGTPAATLPGAWRYRVSAGTGRPGVSILRLGETESLIHSRVAGTLSNQQTTTRKSDCISARF